MTQTTGLAGLSGWLNQILGELDLGAVRGAAEGGDFVRSLAAQIRTLALKHGADPAELAALDDQTLVGRCLALLGDRQPLRAATGLSLGLGLHGLKAEMAEGMPTDSGSEGSGEAAPDTQAQSAVFAWLPAQVLERLQASEALLGVAEGQSSGPVAQVNAQKMMGGEALGAPKMPAGMVRGGGEMGLQASAQPLSPVEQQKVIVGIEPVTQMPEVDILPAATAGQGGPERSAGPSSVAASLPEGEAGMQAAIGQRGGWWRQVFAAMIAETSAGGQSAPAVTGEVGVKDPTREGLGEGVGDQGSAVAAAASSRLAAEPSPVAARAQVLDLNRLLQTGGERPLVEQIRWSVEQGLDTAEIKLNPPNLGSLEVRVVQEGERIHVHFTAAHPVAREVLDAAIPRLREALAQVGLWLGETSVSDQAPRRDQGQGRHNRTSLEAQAIEDLEEGQGGSPGSTLAVLARRLDVFT